MVRKSEKMTAGVCACMFSNKVNGAGRQDGGTDGLTLDGFKVTSCFSWQV